MTVPDAAERNRDLVRRLYDALDRRDGDAMAACYLPDATFRDPVFGTLHGEEVGAMWRMLTTGAKDLRAELVDYDADERSGHARWRAEYEFPPTGRRVTNSVQASFRFAPGGIAEHVDDFSFFSWCRQALGPTGLALGWSPPGRRVVRGRVRGQLQRFQRR